ncbi:hypothetical protein DSO57_1014563 [Entomophthora muscae]|uniref:Uncharacterized protein n=1 Tax=Entomophthora muscae TaxID=34485 RepID=A0ACC2SUC9_9FUNG|nr:hypothetical protein DSO57_1014563 [Entomophthora muscae]
MAARVNSSSRRVPRRALKKVQVVIPKRRKHTRPVKVVRSTVKQVVLHDVDSSYLYLGVQLDQLLVPQIVLVGTDPLFAALFLALSEPREVTGTGLQKGNSINWGFYMWAAEEYSKTQLKEFQFEGQVLSNLQQGIVSNIVKSVLCAWATLGITEAQPVSWKTCHALSQRAGSLTRIFSLSLTFQKPLLLLLLLPQFYVADLLTALASVSPFLWFWCSKFLQLLLFLAALPDDKTQLKRPFSYINKELLKTFPFLKSDGTFFLLGWLYDKVFCNKEEHTPTTYTNQTAHFTAYRSEFSTNSQKVLYLAEKLTGHYRDWFNSHSICNPDILQNYDLFVSSLLSFSGEDKELSTSSASWFAGPTQGLLPLGKYNWKFYSLQSRLQASDTEACSFYKIGLNRLLHLVVFTRKGPTLFNPSTWHQAKVWDRRRNNNFCSYCGSKDHLLPACPLSKCSPFVNKTSNLTFLSLNNTFKSTTVLVTIHGPLGKIKVLALLDTGVNANFIEGKLAKLLRPPAFGSLDVKVGNSTLISATPILQPVTIVL